MNALARSASPALVLCAAAVVSYASCVSEIRAEDAGSRTGYGQADLAFTVATTECRQFGRRVDGGFCPRLCSYEHGDAMGCSPEQVCVYGGNFRRVGAWWGCYDLCDAGCARPSRCREITQSIPQGNDKPDLPTKFMLCIPPEAIVES